MSLNDYEVLRVPSSELTRGPKGEKGEKGDPLSPDRIGASLSERNQYDSVSTVKSFLDTSTGLIYVKNSQTGVWGQGFQLTGQKGDKGDKGDKGNTGNPGQDGSDGADGQTGPQGPGPYGEYVESGGTLDYEDWVEQNLRGQKGETGQIGPIGPAGQTGPSGLDGQSFAADATGMTSERADYDAQEKGFTFRDVSVNPNLIYTKLSATLADWSPAASIQGEPGAVGERGQTGADGKAGRGFNPRDEWSAALNYAVDDLARYQGAVYRRKIAGIFATPPPLAPNQWAPFADKGADGQKGADGVGIPAGGAVGQIAQKSGAGDYQTAFAWQDLVRLDSVAALRALSTTHAGMQAVYVIGWSAGTRTGGGVFRYDSTDTTSLDDGGLVITDAAGRRWKRVMDGMGGIITPYMFGALPKDPSVSNTADYTQQIQAAVDAVRNSRYGPAQNYLYHLHLAGKTWRTSGVNLSLIRSPGFTVKHGALLGFGAGNIVADCAGSHQMKLIDLHIAGDPDDPPDAGLLVATARPYRDDNGNLIYYPDTQQFPQSAKHFISHVTIGGSYTKSAFINFGSESLTTIALETRNDHKSLNAYAEVYASHAGTLDKYVGGLTSKFAHLPQYRHGGNSFIQQYRYQLKANRQTPYEFEIASLAKSAPGQKTKITIKTKANYNVTTHKVQNGDEVYFYDVGGMTALNGKYFPISNVTTISETEASFEIDYDSSSQPNLTTGNVFCRTGPAVLVGSCSGFRTYGGYMLTYGSPSMIVDLTQDAVTEVEGNAKSPTPKSWDIQTQTELSAPCIIRFDITPDRTVNMKDFHFNLLAASQTNREAIFKIGDGSSGTGFLQFDGFEFKTSGGNNNTGPLFSHPERVKIRDADIRLTIGAKMSDPSTFAEFSGRTYMLDEGITRHYGEHQFGPAKIKNGALVPGRFNSATFPTLASGNTEQGGLVYSSNGRRPGEALGAGTGNVLYWDGAAWVNLHALPCAARAHHTDVAMNTAIAHDTISRVFLATEEHDTDGRFTPGSGNSQSRFIANQSGLYRFSGAVTVEAPASGEHWVRVYIRRNIGGVTTNFVDYLLGEVWCTPARRGRAWGMTELQLTSGDHIELRAYHNAGVGVTKSLSVGRDLTFLQGRFAG